MLIVSIAFKLTDDRKYYFQELAEIDYLAEIPFKIFIVCLNVSVLNPKLTDILGCVSDISAQSIN